MTETTREYHRATELSRMRRHMAYGFDDLKQDWGMCIAIAVLLADGGLVILERVLEEALMRIAAYTANHEEEVLWWLKGRQEAKDAGSNARGE